MAGRTGGGSGAAGSGAASGGAGRAETGGGAAFSVGDAAEAGGMQLASNIINGAPAVPMASARRSMASDRRFSGAATGDGADGKFTAGIGFLSVRRPVAQLIKRDLHAGQRAEDMVTSGQHAIAAGLVEELGGA